MMTPIRCAPSIAKHLWLKSFPICSINSKKSSLNWVHHYSTEPPSPRTGAFSSQNIGSPMPPPNSRGSNKWQKLLFVSGGIAFAYFAAQAYMALSNDKTEKSSGPLKTSLNPNEWIPFKLQEVHDINYNTKLFRFELPTKNHVLGMPIASCILTKIQLEGKDPVIRPYTPISPTDVRGYFDLCIKVYKEGPMSEYFFSMKPGDSVLVKGPIAKINYEPNKWKEVGMIAGGTGITPQLQILREALKNPNDKTKFNLIFGNVTKEDLIMERELKAMAVKYPDRFKIHFILDRPEKDWSGGKGYLTKQMVKEHLPEPSPESKVFVCGPSPMMRSVCGDKGKDKTQGEVDSKSILGQLGYTKDDVYKF